MERWSEGKRERGVEGEGESERGGRGRGREREREYNKTSMSIDLPTSAPTHSNVCSAYTSA